MQRNYNILEIVLQGERLFVSLVGWVDYNILEIVLQGEANRLL
jgi:hypothetical protein